MAVTLLITATGLEATPLRAALPWHPLPFLLGDLFYASEGQLYLAHLGLAKVNTAAGLTLALHTLKPDRVIQFGIGGAFRESGLNIGQVAVATQETHMDTGVGLEDTWQDMQAVGFPLLGDYYNTLPVDRELTAEITKLTGAPSHPFGTSEAITGSETYATKLHDRFGVAVESMEGAAAAQVCAAFGIPFAELRGISNIVGERDKATWNLRGAVTSTNEAILRFLDVGGQR